MDFFDHEPGRTAWSRHLYQVDGRPTGVTPPPWVGPDLEPAQHVPSGYAFTCWAEVTGTSPSRLRPVMVSRLLYDRAPVNLLHHSLRPAPALSNLSPADRVFGWVAPADEQTTGRKERRRAHRGQVRVVRVVGPPADKAVVNLDPPRILPALSSPKPSQGRFYLGIKRTGAPDRLQPGTTSAMFFGQNQALRGRKTYPDRRGHHGNNHSTPSGARYEQTPTKQNTTLHQWVAKHATFHFDLLVDNLSDVELGALLWILSPQRLGTPAVSGRPAFPGRMRLGMGKPFGFGVIEVALDEGSTQLARGEQIRQRLAALDASPPDDQAWAGLAAQFEQTVAKDLRCVLTAIRNAATGVGADSTISYPRQSPGDSGYEWFVNNEKVATRRRSQPLPLLHDDQWPVSLWERPPGEN